MVWWYERLAAGRGGRCDDGMQCSQIYQMERIEGHLALQFLNKGGLGSEEKEAPEKYTYLG